MLKVKQTRQTLYLLKCFTSDSHHFIPHIAVGGKTLYYIQDGYPWPHESHLSTMPLNITNSKPTWGTSHASFAKSAITLQENIKTGGPCIYTAHAKRAFRTAQHNTGMETRQHKAIHLHARVQTVTFLERSSDLWLGNTPKVQHHKMLQTSCRLNVCKRKEETSTNFTVL